MQPIGRGHRLVRASSTTRGCPPYYSQPCRALAPDAGRWASSNSHSVATMPSPCTDWFCLVPIAPGQQIFGFSEFLASLALMVIAWTIVDVRYRFRLHTSSLPLIRGSFVSVAAIGVLTLFSDLWRAEGWLVPVGPLSPNIWQAILGLLFLSIFLIWAWIATIRPPSFGPRNALRFGQAVYRLVLRGSPAELEVLADELARSCEPLIKFSAAREVEHAAMSEGKPPRPAQTSDYAHDILLLLADRRFCRALVQASPNTAYGFFATAIEAKRFVALPHAFCKNFLAAAISHRDSFLYHETSGYDSGFLGHVQPISQSLYGNYAMLRANPSLLEVDYFDSQDWTTDQWEAYLRVATLAFGSYCDSALPTDYSPISRTFEAFKNSLRDTYKLNGADRLEWAEGPYARIRVASDYLKAVLTRLEKVPVEPAYNSHRPQDYPLRNVYDAIAEYGAELIWEASTVTGPVWPCWSIQHNTVWSDIFTWPPKGAGATLVTRKLTRRLYADIAELATFPNFKGARILALCLNVMGLELRDDDYGQSYRAFHRVVLRWTRTHFRALHAVNARVAEACLVDSLSYDPENSRLVKTYAADGLALSPRYVYLPLAD